MERYRTNDASDDPSGNAGDVNFFGVDEYSSPENIKPGNVQQAVNHDFSSQDAQTRGGFVCLPELGITPFGKVWNEYSYASFFKGIAYGAGVYVGVSSSSNIYSSINPQVSGYWTPRTSPGAATNYLEVIFANGLFLALGDVHGASSPDGVTWTSVSVTGTCGAFGNSRWLVGSLNKIYTSTNATSWSLTVSFFNSSVSAMAFGNGVFVAAVNGPDYVGGPTLGKLYTVDSATGVNTSLRYSTSTTTFVKVAYGNRKFVALTANGEIHVSDYGDTWTKVRDSDGLNWTELTFGNGVFVAASLNGRLIYSLNSVGWMQVTQMLTSAVDALAYGNGLFLCATNGGGSISTSLGMAPSVFASGLYSDPASPGDIYMTLVGYDRVGFYANGKSSKTVSLNGNYVSQQSTIVQANNQMFLFRGDGQTPLYWDGNWATTFVPVPNTTLPASFNSIPPSGQAVYYQNRLWVKNGKDSIAASDVLAFTDYDPLANEFNLNTGDSDYVVATFPFGQNSLVCFKNKSVSLMQNVEGSLTDVTVTEITRQVGLIGLNAVCSIGPDLAYVSYGNINLLTLTSTNNSLQHKTLPLSTKIRRIMERVNWDAGHKISIGYWNNKLYVALPLDNSTYCNAVVVYNFINENWYGEWNFNGVMNMCVQGWQVADYLGLQRLHAITEDGRILVTDEGQNDISGTLLAEISTLLTTRAYDTSNVNHFQRRLYLDMATCRPKFSCSSFTEGVSESSPLITDQTFSRAESWRFNDTTYDLTNSGNDYNRPYRKDYTTGPLASGSISGQPSTGLQCGTGFMPEAAQEFRMPLVTRRQGRLSWLQVTNTQGFVSVMSVGFELRAGQRSNLIQV